MMSVVYGRRELLRRELDFWKDESRRLALLSLGHEEWSEAKLRYDSQATYAFNRLRGVRRELEACL